MDITERLQVDSQYHWDRFLDETGGSLITQQTELLALKEIVSLRLKVKNLLLEHSKVRPMCFDSIRQWEKIKRSLKNKGIDDLEYCKLCDKTRQKEMVDQGRCNHPSFNFK